MYSYSKRGQGPLKLVFLHYFGGDADSWNWLIDKLETKFTCYSLNLPGFNNTPIESAPSLDFYANYINDFIIDQKLLHYVIVGHSMSAKLALLAASKILVKPNQLILVAPSPPTIEKMTEPQRLRMLNHPDKEEAITTVKNSILNNLSAEKFEHAVNTQLNVKGKAWQWWIEEGMLTSIATDIEDLDILTTVIASENDPVIPLTAIKKEVLPYLRNNQLIVYKHCGHLIPLELPEELPEELARTIVDILVNHELYQVT